jgi:NDP-sugar pyrophosphorylase family protein
VKCLTEFDGRIFLDYLLEQAQAAGIKHVIILGGPDRDVIKKAVRVLNYSMDFSFPEEKERLGTGGALPLIAPYLGESHFILSNADTYFLENPFDLLKSQSLQGNIAMFYMRNRSAERSFQEVSSLEGRSWVDLYQTDSYIYTGLAVLSAEIIQHWNLLGLNAACSFEKDVFGKIKGRAKFIAYPFAEIDFGTEAGFKHLKEIFKKEAV